MDAHVGALRCRYLVLGGEARAAARTAAALDRRVRPRLARALGEALEKALAGDPSVYVLRRAHTRLALGLGPGLGPDLGQVSGDGHLARLWGDRLAGAVMRAIARDSGDGANLVRFESQADYVAHFVADLLRERAWRCWFYLPFRSLRPRPRGEVLRTVLLDHRADLAKILAQLLGQGMLEELLAAVDRPTAELLWRRGLAGLDAAEPEALRPLFAAALRLAAALGLETPTGPAAELFRSYLETGPAMPDWGSRRGLAEGVLDALDFLIARRGPPSAVASGTLAPLLAELDWLDADWLGEAIARRLAQRPVEASDPDLPRRPHPALTPRQRELLADLAAALADAAPRLDRTRPRSAANALRFAAALAARAPRWRGDPLLAVTVEEILAGWDLLAAADSPRDALHRLLRGEIEGALRAVPETDRSWAVRPLGLLAGLGEPGLEELERLLEGTVPPAASPMKDPSLPRSSPRAVTETPAGITSPCAGIFLLLRAARDVRLASLVESAAWPSRGPRSALVLAALGLRWAGPEALAGDRIDPAIALFAGLTDLAKLPSVRTLREAFPEAGDAGPQRFQEELLRAAAGQRLVDGRKLRLYLLGTEDGVDGDLLVAGTGGENGDLWPLGKTLAEDGIDGTGALATTAGAWIAGWRAATGREPELVTCDAELLPALGGLTPEPRCPAATGEPGNGDAPALDAHREGRRRLVSALASLDSGRLGLPAADLTLALTAIVLLRLWSRWLRHFAGSSVPFLLDRFIRREGRVFTDQAGVEVELAPGSLDLVLEIAGYLEDLDTPEQRTVRFAPRSW